MLLALAWRNIWRNSRRSLITMVALALGVAGITGLHSYRDSVYAVMIGDITRGLVGHLQVHGQGYQDAPAVGTLVRDPVQVEAALAQALPGATAERRVLGAGLAGAGDQSAPVIIVGLAPAPGERGALHTVASGRDLSPQPAREVLVGKDLARDLGVKVGDELVLVSQAADGSVANDRYTVHGTFTSGSAELDQAAVLLHLKDAQDFFVLGDGVHQLVVRLPESADKEDVAAPVAALRGALDLTTLEALSWGEMLPELKSAIKAKRRGQHALDLVVFLIVALGVFNAMAMATFERTRELGVLAALGSRPGRLLGLILVEALLQGVLAFAVGLALGAGLVYGFGTISLSGFVQGDLMGARMPDAVTLGLQREAVVSAAVVAFSTVLLGGLVPALRAAALKPVDAMRHS